MGDPTTPTPTPPNAADPNPANPTMPTPASGDPTKTPKAPPGTPANPLPQQQTLPGMDAQAQIDNAVAATLATLGVTPEAIAQHTAAGTPLDTKRNITPGTTPTKPEPGKPPMPDATATTLENLTQLEAQARTRNQEYKRFEILGEGDVVTGRTKWAELQKFAADTKNLQANEFDSIKTMLAGDDYQVSLALQDLNRRYEASAEVSSQQAMIEGNVSLNGSVFKKLSRKEYVSELNRLRGENASDMELHLLGERRMATKRLEQH